MEGWKKKSLTEDGREVLTKSVALSIPFRYMMCFKIPKSICKYINAVVSLLVGTEGNKQKIHIPPNLKFSSGSFFILRSQQNWISFGWLIKYALCKKIREIPAHIYGQRRDISRDFWFRLHAQSSVPNFFQMDLEDWIKWNLQITKLMVSNYLPWSVIFAYAVWILWLNRNKLGFQSQRIINLMVRDTFMQAPNFMFLVLISKLTLLIYFPLWVGFLLRLSYVQEPLNLKVESSSSKHLPRGEQTCGLSLSFG